MTLPAGGERLIPEMPCPRPSAVLCTALLAGLGGLLTGCATGREGFAVGRLDGSAAVLHPEPDTQLWVFTFLGVECPISNRCLPELAELEREHSSAGVRFVFVYPNADEGADAIRRHQADYGLAGEACRDPGHALARQLGASKTPEVVVLTPQGEPVYRGRINDQYLALGQGKPAPTRHDLAEALDAFRSGRPPSGLAQPAVGCTFRSLP